MNVTDLDRQQIIAIAMVVLMLASSVAYVATLF